MIEHLEKKEQDNKTKNPTKNHKVHRTIEDCKIINLQNYLKNLRERQYKL